LAFTWLINAPMDPQPGVEFSGAVRLFFTPCGSPMAAIVPASACMAAAGGVLQQELSSPRAMVIIPGGAGGGLRSSTNVADTSGVKSARVCVSSGSAVLPQVGPLMFCSTTCTPAPGASVSPPKLPLTLYV
jgi:hypothetical protein